MAELELLDKVWESRGDYFDGIFDSATTIWEAVSKIARCGRALPILQSGMVRIIRDEPKTIPTAMYTPRNIIKDSFSIEYVMPSEDTADSVKVQYFSNKYWKYDNVVTKLPDSTEENPANVDLFGCTDKAHAEREGYYMCACNRYRRKYITFSTELEGLIPTYGDLIAITHDMAHWGQGGEIIARNGLKLTLSEPVAFIDGVKNILALRNKNGSLGGVYEVTATELSTEVTLKTQPDIEILTASGVERTHFAFGSADKWSVFARVTGIRPRSNQVEITAVIEDDRVHQN